MTKIITFIFGTAVNLMMIFAAMFIFRHATTMGENIAAFFLFSGGMIFALMATFAGRSN